MKAKCSFCNKGAPKEFPGYIVKKDSATICAECALRSLESILRASKKDFDTLTSVIHNFEIEEAKGYLE